MDARRNTYAKDWMEPGADRGALPTAEERALAGRLQMLGKADNPSPDFTARLAADLDRMAAGVETQGRIPIKGQRSLRIAYQWGLGLFGLVMLVGIVVFSMKLLPEQVTPGSNSTEESAVLETGTPTALPSEEYQGFLAPPENLGNIRINASVPQIPGRLGVYWRGLQDTTLTIERAQAVAARLGIKGQPQACNSEDLSPCFTITDGKSKITVYSDQPLEFYYNAEMNPSKGESEKNLTYEELASTAEAFLLAHQLLDFDYRIDRPIGTPWEDSSVMVVPKLDNGVLYGNGDRNPGVWTIFDGSGEVLSVNTQLFPLDKKGEDRPRPADQVWSDFTGSRIYSSVDSIEQIELVYYAEDFQGMSVNAIPEDSELRVVSPMWRFRGQMRDGRWYELLVPAGIQTDGVVRIQVTPVFATLTEDACPIPAADVLTLNQLTYGFRNISGMAGGDKVESGPFTIKLWISCYTVTENTAPEPYTPLPGLGMFYEVRYRGPAMEGDTEEFAGLEPFVERVGGLGDVTPNSGSASWHQMRFSDMTSDLTNLERLHRYVYQVQLPDGSMYGAALSFVLVRESGGYKPVDIQVEPLSQEEVVPVESGYTATP